MDLLLFAASNLRGVIWQMTILLRAFNIYNFLFLYHQARYKLIFNISEIQPRFLV